MSPLRWPCKSTRKLADELTGQGHPVSARTVAELLVDMGYSLQATSKQVEGAQHPDRDGQVRSVNEQATAPWGGPAGDQRGHHQEGGRRQPGQQGSRRAAQGDPVRVDVHDFPDPKVAKAIPRRRRPRR
jgi:Rhodopirellula transposase DDE domain